MDETAEQSAKKTRKKIKIIWLVVVLVLVGGAYQFGRSGQLSDKTLTIKTPYTASIAGHNSYSCEALMSADIYELSAYGEIEGNLGPGTDKVAIEIMDDETVNFITRAAVEAGETEAAKFTIITNTDDALVAASISPFGDGLDIIYINKRTGLAAWSDAQEFLGGTSGSVIFLKCI